MLACGQDAGAVCGKPDQFVGSYAVDLEERIEYCGHQHRAAVVRFGRLLILVGRLRFLSFPIALIVRTHRSRPAGRRIGR